MHTWEKNLTFMLSFKNLGIKSYILKVQGFMFEILNGTNKI